jgi:dolichyl-phosphate beta-glucosyltransferase
MVHLVIPCFQESSRVGPFIEDLKRVFAVDEGLRILLVDDGSPAEEQKRFLEVVDPLIKDGQLFLPPLILPDNIGKGGAIYAGWATSDTADWLAFVDADGSCSAQETKRLIELARQQSEPISIFASRVKMLGHHVERHFKRHLVGRVYATLVSELLNIEVYDSQCGLKVIHGAAYREIAKRLTIEGFAFDVDLLVHLLDAGHKIKEEPIDWHDTPGGKIRLLRDSWRMFRDVLKIRRNRRRPIHR